MNGREDIAQCRREQEACIKQTRAWIEAKNPEISFKTRDFDNVVILNYASPLDMHIMKVSFHAILPNEIVLIYSNLKQKPIHFLRFLLNRSINM